MWFDKLLSRPPVARDGNNLIFDANGSEEWSRRQDESVKRYADETYEEDPTIGRMFGNFIATGLPDRNAVVLDVGCGLFPDLPHYVAQLGLKRFVALEPLTTPVDRSYPCLVGAVAEDIPLKDGTVDAALFATSLDHIEDEGAALAEVRRVLRPDGKIYVWQGLYDPIIVARTKTFERSFSEGELVAVPLMAIEALLTVWRIKRRRRQLKTGSPIDSAHFRWHTRKTVRETLGGLEIARELEPPGTNSIFIEARAPHRPSP